MTHYHFDDRTTHWYILPGIEHLAYHILHIDEPAKIIDVLFKFSANQQIVLHRHLALNNTFVIQGEHRLYAPNGHLKEARPAGRYTSTPASDEPHREGGGEEDAIVFFSIRGSDGVLYEILDDAQTVIATLSMPDFISLYNAQSA